MLQKVEYLIELTQVGEGAKLATNQLIQLNNAARTAGTGAASVTGNLAALSATAKGSTIALHEVTSIMFLLGGPKIQEAAIGVTAFAGGLRLVKIAAAGIGLAAAAALTALGIAAAGTAYSFIKVAEAEDAATLAAIQGEESLVARAEKIESALLKAIDDGRAKITDQQASLWDAILTRPTDASLRKLTLEVGELFPNLLLSDATRAQKVSKEMADLARQQAHADAQLRNANPNLSAKAQAMLLEQNYQDIVAKTIDLENQGLMTSIEATNARTEADTRRLLALNALGRQLTDIQRLEEAATKAFASGLSQAIVDFASGTKSAEEAFKQFAATFLQEIAKMILEQQILNIISGITKAFSGAGGGGGAVSLAASFANGAQGLQMGRGGARLMAGGGISEVSTPTFFPRFNVIAGEAGREVMTVMARPRLMDVGGIAAQVGDVGPNRLALTNAGDLQALGRGASGHIRITIDHSESSRLNIINEAVGVSVHTVTRKMTERGPLSENTRRLINQ